MTYQVSCKSRIGEHARTSRDMQQNMTYLADIANMLKKKSGII